MTRTQAPTVPVVSIEELRTALRKTSSIEDDLVVALEAAAVAHLDGYDGVLGRAIMPQKWRQDFDGWGDLRLALPDVSAVTVTAKSPTGVDVAPDAVELRRDGGGWIVFCSGPAVASVSVEMTVALPEAKLPAVKAAVKMLVGHWYVSREAAGGALSEIPLGVSALIAPLRVQQL